jgi:predicted RNase H-like HicB family nuclease
MKHRFAAIFEKEEEGGYHTFWPALPGCRSHSENVEEGIGSIQETAQLYVESLVEDGLLVPKSQQLTRSLHLRLPVLM